MKVNHFLVFITWSVYYVRSFPGRFYQRVQVLPPATSFIARTDEFHSNNVKIPKQINFNGVSSAFHHTFTDSFDGHISPDFSDGLAYPDPFLLTGVNAKRIAAFLYSKELFFSDIPHVRGLTHNQQKRIENGLPPHELGSLRISSPWYRFKQEEYSRVGHFF